MEALRVARVLPRLVLEPARRPPLVLDEAVAVAVAVRVDPVAAPRARARSAAPRARRRPSSATPPRAGRGRAASRRRCRSRCRTRSGPRARGGARAGSCPARRRSTRRPPRLQRRERARARVAELGPEQQRLQARDQRVAAEDGHEPRHPRGRQLADAVRRRASAAPRDRRPTARTPAQLGRHARSRGTCRCHAGERVAHVLPAPRRTARSTARRRLLAAQRRDDVDSGAPSAGAARARARSATASRRAARLRRGSPASCAIPPSLLEHELVLPPSTGSAAGRRQRRAVGGLPSEKSCSLTEMMSAKSVPTSSSSSKESGSALSLRRGSWSCMPLADEALARDRERVLREPGTTGLRR